MSDDAARRIRTLARALAGLAGAGLLVSLFLTWSRLTLRQLAFLAVAADGSLRGVAVRHDAWGTGAGLAVALTLAAVLIAAAAVIDRARLLGAATLAALAGLIVTVGTVADPPTTLPGRLALPAGAGQLLVSQGGGGEIMAVAACGAALAGLVAVMAVEARSVRPRRPQG